MDMDEDKATIAPDRLSIDTLANINEDVTWASEVSGHSRPPMSDSVFSSLRQSIDGGSNHVGAFNILKQLNGIDDDKILAEGSPLGPNSIFDLTAGLDHARLRLNKGLKAMVLINGGANKVYNLIKPSTREIPPIQLHPLDNKVSKSTMYSELVDNVSEDYKAFELSYKSLTMDTLSKLSQQYEEQAESFKGVEDKESNDELPNLDIPEVFETADFHLEDQRVFRQVMEGSSIFPENDNSQDLQLVHNSKVQESLSHYLDNVEVHIVKEISQTADSFFATLDDIEDIKKESQKCIESYDRVMDSLNEMQEQQADVGLELLNLIDQQRNVNHLESTVLQIDAVVKGFDKALDYVNDGKNIDCLNQILVLQSLIKGVPREEYPDEESLLLYPQFKYPLVDLSQLGALKNKQKSINALKSTCCRKYIDELVELLLEDLKAHQSSVSSQDLINRIYMATTRDPSMAAPLTPSFHVIHPGFRERVSVFIHNLAKSGYLVLAFAQYKETIIRQVKSIIRDLLPSSRPDSTQMEQLFSTTEPNLQSVNSENGRSNSQEPGTVAGSTINGSLTNSIKSMSDDDFLNMMREIFANLSECLRRLTVHQKFLLDISLSILPRSLNIDVMSLDISPKINNAIELTQVRLTKLLNVRLEALGDLPLQEYLQVFLLTSGYLQECESIDPSYNSLEQGGALNEWVRNHMTYYCHRTHTSALKRLVHLCEKELWKEISGPSLIPAQKQINELLGYVSHVVTGKGIDGSEWTRKYLDFRPNSGTVSTVLAQSEQNEVHTHTLTKLTVKDESFFVPSFILTVICMARDYIIFTHIFSGRSTVVIQNFLNYFKVLNSRISYSILSAGATKTAGLKHITTRHLALCLQTVEFLCAFLKQIQLAYPANANAPSDSDSDNQTFEQVVKSFQDHEQALFAKIVSIMHDRTTNHCAVILKLDLSKAISHPQQCHSYMETLVKETLTVANVLGRYIGENELTLILLQIFDNYKKLLVNCICGELPQLKDFNEKHSLLKDIDYFRVKLGELPGYGNSGQVIWENVNSLPTIEDSKMEEVMRNNINGERAAAESVRASMEQTASEEKVTKTTDLVQTLIVSQPNPESAEGPAFEKIPDGAKEPNDDSPANQPVNDNKENIIEEEDEGVDEKEEMTMNGKVEEHEEADNSPSSAASDDVKSEEKIVQPEEKTIKEDSVETNMAFGAENVLPTEVQKPTGAEEVEISSVAKEE